MSVKLFAPNGYLQLDIKERLEIVNGCGPGGWKFDFVPDKILGLCIRECCNIHDYMYHIGQSIVDKKVADRVFLNNMIRLIDHKTKWRWLRNLRKKIAYGYYVAVKKFGGPAFWANKNEQVDTIRI